VGVVARAGILSDLNRYKRYRNRIFEERYDQIYMTARKDKFFPKSLEKCFRKLHMNPDQAMDTILGMIESSKLVGDDDTWAELCWFLIHAGYALGLRSAKKYKQEAEKNKPIILRFPREK
jgi:hypothetical protein